MIYVTKYNIGVYVEASLLNWGKVALYPHANFEHLI